MDISQPGALPQPEPIATQDSPAASAAPPTFRPFRRGELCPNCDLGVLEYNGMLDLECPECGYSQGSGAGCT
jgi:hypothetical protein